MKPVRGGFFVHVDDANASDMSTEQRSVLPMADSFLNKTAALGLQDQDTTRAMFEFKVFNMVIIVLALCVLTVTGLYCITVCYSRTRQSKRAHIYESAVTRGEQVDPVAVKAVKRSTSFINPLTLFRKPEAAKDNSRIYYIYSNPLPVGLKEDEDKAGNRVRGRSEEQAALLPSMSLEEYANAPNSCIVLDPPIFYMQL